MNGNEEFDKKNQKSIQKLILKNPEKRYLAGYCSFIGNSSLLTVYNYARHVVNFMEYNDNKKLERLGLDDYTSYLSTIKHTSSSNQITVYAALKHFSYYLLASGKNQGNYMQYVKRPKYTESQQAKEKREIGYLNKKEISQFIQAIDSGVGNERALKLQEKWKERDKLIALLFLNTGMRCTALCKLDLSNINFDKKQLIITDKGNKVHEYELSDELMVFIVKWLNKRKEILQNQETEALFVTSRKERIKQGAVAKIIGKYASAITQKHITPHKLRATYGTQLYAVTKDLYFTQQCMGHNSPKTTELYIRGQESESKKKAAVIMSKITMD